MITGTFLCVLFVPIFYVMIMRIAGSADEREVDLNAVSRETAMEAASLKDGELTFYEPPANNADDTKAETSAQASTQIAETDSAKKGE